MIEPHIQEAIAYRCIIINQYHLLPDKFKFKLDKLDELNSINKFVRRWTEKTLSQGGICKLYMQHMKLYNTDNLCSQYALKAVQLLAWREFEELRNRTFLIDDCDLLRHCLQSVSNTINYLGINQ